MKSQSRFAYFLQEVLIVVIGVLIAVSINNFREARADAKYLAKTLEAIDTEVKVSKEEIDTVMARHIKLLATWDEVIANDELSLEDVISERGGIQGATVQNISLRFFVSNKAELLDFETIAMLLSIENQSNVLYQKLSRLTDFLYTYVSSNSLEAKQEFAIFLENVIDSEYNLSESYAEYLKIKADRK